MEVGDNAKEQWSIQQLELKDRSGLFTNAPKYLDGKACSAEQFKLQSRYLLVTFAGTTIRRAANILYQSEQSNLSLLQLQAEDRSTNPSIHPLACGLNQNDECTLIGLVSHISIEKVKESRYNKKEQIPKMPQVVTLRAEARKTSGLLRIMNVCSLAGSSYEIQNIWSGTSIFDRRGQLLGLCSIQMSEFGNDPVLVGHSIQDDKTLYHLINPKY